MLRKIVLVLAIIVGCVAGGGGGWIFHFVIEANAHFLTQHQWLSASVGVAMLLLLSRSVYESKRRSPRFYGLFVLGIAAGIFIQAIFFFPEACPELCNTDFKLKLGGCLILMVEGFGSFYRESAIPRGTEKVNTHT
jgi:hypothetical protein